MTDLVNEDSNDNGQDTGAKTKPKVSEEGNVNVMDFTTIVIELSCMEEPLDNPPIENEIEDNPYKNPIIGMHKKT